VIGTAVTASFLARPISKIKPSRCGRLLGSGELSPGKKCLIAAATKCMSVGGKECSKSLRQERRVMRAIHAFEKRQSSFWDAFPGAVRRAGCSAIIAAHMLDRKVIGAEK